MAISLVIFEDNHPLRQSLEVLLNDGVHFQVTGAFGECTLASDQVQLLKPDLVLMDINMPGLSGIEGLKNIKQTSPETKIIMYTVLEDENVIFDCMCAGADGYLLKNTPPAKIIQALEEAVNGGAPMSPGVAAKVLAFFRNSLPGNNYNLTKRETEILQHLVNGLSYKMIADASFISVDTVKKHLKNIYAKLHVSCGTEAVAKAIREKIVNF